MKKGPEQTTVTIEHSNFERHDKGWDSMLDGVSGEGGWPGIMNRFSKLIPK